MSTPMDDAADKDVGTQPLDAKGITVLWHQRGFGRFD
jgi:hypothetical protein